MTIDLPLNLHILYIKLFQSQFLFKMRKSNDNQLSHFGFIEEIMGQSY